MFDSVMKNKSKNTFQCLVMSWKIKLKIIFFFSSLLKKKSNLIGNFLMFGYVMENKVKYILIYIHLYQE